MPNSTVSHRSCCPRFVKGLVHSHVYVMVNSLGVKNKLKKHPKNKQRAHQHPHGPSLSALSNRWIQHQSSLRTDVGGLLQICSARERERKKVELSCWLPMGGLTSRRFLSEPRKPTQTPPPHPPLAANNIYALQKEEDKEEGKARVPVLGDDHCNVQLIQSTWMTKMIFQKGEVVISWCF